MCGIAGIIRLDGAEIDPCAREAVAEMLDAMKWRGPDGEGIWLDGPACFGHRRLSIIDIAGGAQPMHYQNGKLTVVFNGEIYNFREERENLSRMGHKFASDCDTEVILASYAQYERDCLSHLEGMFAFSLWDKSFKQLFCARDIFGKKPFYYTIQNGFFAFSSELTSLATLKSGKYLPPFHFTISRAAFSQYLAYEYVPVPQSIYREVSVLEPAHWLILKNGEVKLGRYWDLPWPEKKMPADAQEVCGEVWRLMKRATAMRMISDVPLGVFLSGGIDSTIVAGLMASLSTKPIKAFSIGFKEASYDESSYARIAARAYGAEHHERILSAGDCADELPKLARQMDTPMADASIAPTWLLSALARKNVTVALGGDGADEFWAGYEHYIGYRISLWYNRLPKFLRSFVNAASGLLPQSSGYVNPRLAVRTFLEGAAAPDWLRVQTMLTSFGANAQSDLLTGEWLAKSDADILNPDTLYASTAKYYNHWPDDSATPLERAFYVYVRQFMLDDILVKVDRCSMLHSLEVRAPFLDKQVCEFVAKLPLNAKLHGFRRKYLLKKAFVKLLPREILHRNKRGFQIPVSEWLRSKLKPLLLEFLSPEYLRSQGIFNPEPVGRMLEEHFAGTRDYRKQLWTLLVLQLWLDARRPDF